MTDATVSRTTRARGRCTVTVDAAAIALNVARLVEAASPAELWAVVKADGYGHGAAVTARAALAAGASKLCVAGLREAQALREAVPGAPVLVMGPLVPGEEDGVRDVEVTVPSVDAYARLRASRAEPSGVHVKVDTGMGRWGMAVEEARRVGAALAEGGRLRLAGLMSHLATADSDAGFVGEQARRFAAVAERFPPCPRHLANSAATLAADELGGPLRWDAVRCGVAVYGLSPFGDDPGRHGLSPALAFTSYTADVKRLAAGESAGYGRRLVAREPTWIGLVPAGYGDGVPRLLSGRMEVIVRGRRRPVEATISMDQLTYTIGPVCDVDRGDPVTLLGTDGDEAVHAEEWARLTGTINYEITTGIGPRAGRVAHVVAGA